VRVALAAPYRFRFTEPEDVKQYGDGWFVYDEARVVRLPARSLARYEARIGMPIAQVIDGFRQDSVMGRLAATWLALHMHDPDLAGDFDQYSPVVLLMRFEPVPDGELPAESREAAAPLDSTPDGSPSGAGSA
jgi:hypothetical protein